MNLQRYLLLHIGLATLLSLLLTAKYLLYQSHLDFNAHAQQAATALQRQLLQQLQLRPLSMEKTDTFPNFELWKTTYAQPGICIYYTPLTEGHAHSLCNGGVTASPTWPEWFAQLYGYVFGSTTAIINTLSYNGRELGTLTLSSEDNLEIAAGWHTLHQLMQLFTVTLIGVGLLTYLRLQQALKPVNRR